MKWRAEFIGREIGAIGVFHPITIEVEGDTEDEANLNIYETHEHVFKLTLTPLEDDAVRAYRIDPSESHPGKFQVRVRQNPGGEAMWFDAGDPCDTREEAEAKMERFKTGTIEDSHGFIHADCDGQRDPGIEEFAGQIGTIPPQHARLICLKCSRTFGEGAQVRDVNLSAYYRAKRTSL